MAEYTAVPHQEQILPNLESGHPVYAEQCLQYLSFLALKFVAEWFGWCFLFGTAIKY